MKPQHIFVVDFNEMVMPDLVLFTKLDTRADAVGNQVHLAIGMTVSIFEEDVDKNGQSDPLTATGRLEINTQTDWSAHVKWCCRIDSNGISHQSDRIIASGNK